MGQNRPGSLLVAAIAVASCISPHGTRLPPVQKTISFPPLNESVQADVGKILVANGNFFAYDGIRLRNTITARLGVGGNPAMGIRGTPPNVMLRPQFLFPQSEDQEYEYYTGNVRFYYRGATVADTPGTAPSQWKVGGLRIRKDDWNDVAIWAPGHDRIYDPEFPARSFRIGYPKEEPRIASAVIERSMEGSWAKEVTFVSVEDDGILNFRYLEHKGDASRPVDTEKISFDPAGESSLFVQGARLEIEGTHGDKVFYRVLENFPPPRDMVEAAGVETVMGPE
jgi:hypothetical protein